MKATYSVKGVDCSGKDFVDKVEVELLPPAANEPHYGTGIYLKATITGSYPTNTHLVDVRYAKTSDIDKLSRMFLESHYGTNIREVTLESCSEI